MVKGYKNKNREREREHNNFYPNVPVAVAVRSDEARQSERGWQRDAGRARNRLGRSLSSDAQVEFAAEAEAEQRESKSM